MLLARVQEAVAFAFTPAPPSWFILSPDTSGVRNKPKATAPAQRNLLWHEVMWRGMRRGQ